MGNWLTLFFEYIGEGSENISVRALGKQAMNPLSLSILLNERGSGRKLITETLISQCLIILSFSLWLCARPLPLDFFHIYLLGGV